MQMLQQEGTSEAAGGSKDAGRERSSGRSVGVNFTQLSDPGHGGRVG